MLLLNNEINIRLSVLMRAYNKSLLGFLIHCSAFRGFTSKSTSRCQKHMQAVIVTVHVGS